MKRNRTQLEQAIEHASNDREKAIAYYNLGLFHDNNGRESVAIPNYKKSLELGLPKDVKPMALAWLASSLYKTNKETEGLRVCRESLKIAKDEKLKKFLSGLERRIQKSLR